MRFAVHFLSFHREFNFMDFLPFGFCHFFMSNVFESSGKMSRKAIKFSKTLFGVKKKNFRK